MKTPSETKVGGVPAATRRSTPSVPAVIEYKKMRFMIMDRPTNANLKTYIEVVKISKPSHASERLYFVNFETKLILTCRSFVPS